MVTTLPEDIMAERKIVYLSGVTGVGKTTLSKEFAENHSGWRRVGGGEMLAKAYGHMSDAERDKLRDNTGYVVLMNQFLIVKAFQALLEETDENILFDGHCLVRTTDWKLRLVPTCILQRMGATKVVYVEEPSEVILERRRNDTLRPGREVETYEELVSRLACSEHVSRRYSRKLGIPYVGMMSPTAEEFAKAVLG